MNRRDRVLYLPSPVSYHSPKERFPPTATFNRFPTWSYQSAMPPYLSRTNKGNPYLELAASALYPEKFDMGTDYKLELNSVSYIRSFTSGRFYAKVFNPPITAQFLKDVNLDLRGGEILGLIGSSGSGKTTLLNVIARRVQGTTGGGILLNHRPMTELTFQNNCAYVSFRQTLNPHLTVRQTLEFHADLALAPALSDKEKQSRINQLCREFELLDYFNRKVDKLHESAKRRLLIAYHLLRDPVLLLVDDLTRGLDALSSYQTIYILSQYVKKYNRMVILSMIMPRSDIYPLLDRMTLLFFGEIMYSGYTKLMPQYFRNVGFPCPASENPAIYFLSLATVDRETSERYLETQDQAVKLIEVFKTEGAPFSTYLPPIPENLSVNPYLPLSSFGRPDGFAKCGTLIRRNYATLFGNREVLLMHMLSLPVFAVFLFVFCFRLKEGPTWPQSMAGLIFNCITAVSMISCALTASTFDIHRLRFYQESQDNLYSGLTFICSHLVYLLPFDLITIFGFSAVIYWGCGLNPDGVKYTLFSVVLWCCYQCAALQTLSLMVFIKSAYKSATTSVTIVAICVTAAGGFLKAIKEYSNGGGDWLYYLSYGTIYRFAGTLLQTQEIRGVNITVCQGVNRGRTQDLSVQICRWDSGNDYLNELYKESEWNNTTPWLNLGLCLAFVAATTVITLLLYVIPMPHSVKRKFRYK